MPNWFEDEKFWEKLYPFLFTDRKLGAAETEIDSVLRLADLDRGDVLDLACGPGRHSVALAKRGFRVTGVDLSAFLLGKARQRARAHDVDVEWIQEDMRRFVRPEAFDLALSLFTSFGYFESKDDDLTVLRNIRKSLRPGGTLAMEIAGREALARRFQPTTSKELADGRLLVERHEIVDDWTRIRNHWIAIEDDTAESFRFDVAVYSGQELKNMLFDAGFSDIKLYGGYDGREYALDAERLVAVARKQSTTTVGAGSKPALPRHPVVDLP